MVGHVLADVDRDLLAQCGALADARWVGGTWVSSPKFR